jgi:hypothetical protein
MSHSKRAASSSLLPTLGALAGIALVGWVVQRTDTSALLSALETVLPWLPLLLCLEGARIVLEAHATGLLLRGETIGFGALVRLQLVTNACAAILPAGRLAGEALRVASLAPVVGSARATAAGVVSQVLNLLANGIASLLAAFAALLLVSRTELLVALAANGALLLAIALGVQVAARGGLLQRLLGRFARLRDGLARFRLAAARSSLLPLGPALAFTLGRVAQAAVFVILFATLGDQNDARYGVVAHGVTLVASTVADAVPAQAGATEYALVAAASELRLDGALALAIALIVRATQLFWALVGALVAATLRVGARRLAT